MPAKHAPSDGIYTFQGGRFKARKSELMPDGAEFTAADAVITGPSENTDGAGPSQTAKPARAPRVKPATAPEDSPESSAGLSWPTEPAAATIDAGLTGATGPADPEASAPTGATGTDGASGPADASPQPDNG